MGLKEAVRGYFENQCWASRCGGLSFKLSMTRAVVGLPEGTWSHMVLGVWEALLVCMQNKMGKAIL